MNIELKDLSYVYEKAGGCNLKAVDSVSLKIASGQYTSVVGHNGSGKSTLVKLIGGLKKPTGGSVFIDGVNIFENTAAFKEIRKKIGFVFQNPEHQLFELTVAADIAFGLKNLNLPEYVVENRVKEIVSLVGLNEEVLLRNPFELSGGEQRKVAIAGVLIMEPEVLILDEPSAGLDPDFKALMLEFFYSYGKRKNCTIIHVTHNINDIAEYADKILVLNDGKKYIYGSFEKVFIENENLEDIGLDIPILNRVFLKLKEKGLNIPVGVKNVEEAAKIIEKMIFKKRQSSLWME